MFSFAFRIEHWFHVAAWVIPLLELALVVAFKAIAGDPFSGLCALSGPRHVFLLQLAPLLLKVLVGVAFLLAGIRAGFKLHALSDPEIKAQIKASIQSLMTKILLFSAAHIVPVLAFISAHIVLASDVTLTFEVRFGLHLAKTVTQHMPGIACIGWVLKRKYFSSLSTAILKAVQWGQFKDKKQAPVSDQVNEAYNKEELYAEIDVHSTVKAPSQARPPFLQRPPVIGGPLTTYHM